MADYDPLSRSDTVGLRANRACRNCVQIKAKCVPLEGSHLQVCQRCHRLRKACSTAPPAVKKRAKEQSRVAQLEKRLDEFSHLLATMQKPSPNEVVPSLPTPASLPAVDAELEPSTIFGNCNDVAKSDETDQALPYSQPDASQEEELLDSFRQNMSYFFPFVILPSRVSAASMRNSRPHLLRSCLFASSRRFPTWQRQLAQIILRHISEGMLLYGERSLDLLQGILVFTTWYHYHGHLNPQLMNLQHLAMSLLIDLGFGSSTARFHSGTANTISTDAERIIHGKAVARGVKTNEERRAVLACYYMATTYSFCFHRLEFMRSTTHLDQCCNDLSASAEYPSDQSLLAIVRLHQLLEKYVMHTDAKPASSMPLSLYVKLFRQDLQAFLDSQLQNILTDELFTLHLLSAEVCFYESIVPMPCENNIDKLEALHTGLVKVQDYFSAVLAQYTASMPSIPYYYWMRIIHALSTLTKLSFLHLEGWDLQYVRETVKFCDLIDRLNGKLWSVHETEVSHRKLAFCKRFRIYKAKLEKCKFWFNEMIEQETRAKGTDDQTFDFNDPMFNGMLDNLDEYLNMDFSTGWAEIAQA